MTPDEHQLLKNIVGDPLADLFAERGYQVEITDNGLSIIDPNPNRKINKYVQLIPEDKSCDEPGK